MWAVNGSLSPAPLISLQGSTRRRCFALQPPASPAARRRCLASMAALVPRFACPPPGRGALPLPPRRRLASPAACASLSRRPPLAPHLADRPPVAPRLSRRPASPRAPLLAGASSPAAGRRCFASPVEEAPHFARCPAAE